MQSATSCGTRKMPRKGPAAKRKRETARLVKSRASASFQIAIVFPLFCPLAALLSSRAEQEHWKYYSSHTVRLRLDSLPQQLHPHNGCVDIHVSISNPGLSVTLARSSKLAPILCKFQAFSPRFLPRFLRSEDLSACNPFLTMCDNMPSHAQFDLHCFCARSGCHFYTSSHSFRPVPFMFGLSFHYSPPLFLSQQGTR